ncbi:MAG: extracellular solute-binding protein [Clostridia bacterium]|nr:extracellular solute-binding protein [Clostridia bacterium]
MKQTGKMKKLLIHSVAAVMACTTIGSLAACGSEPPVIGGSHSGSGVVFNIPEGGYDGSKQKVTFYHTMGSNLREVLDDAIVEFNKLYPNITIEHEQVGGYDDVRTRISTELTVDNHPSMAYCYPDHVALYNMFKAVITLDNLIASDITVTHADGTTESLGYTDEQVADFIPAYYNEGKAYGDDLMYTLPLSKSTELLYYDATFFAEHNLTPPTTWDEMEAMCATIKEIDPECIPLGYDSEANWFITMCEQQGSPYTSSDPAKRFLFDVEENHQFVARFAEWFEKGYITTSEIYGQYTSNLFKNVGGQRAYMCIGSSAGATHQRPGKDAEGNYLFDVGITSIPQLNPSNPKVISQGPSICIFNDSNKQEVLASWLFTKYLTSNVIFQADFADVSGYVPVIKSVESDPIYAANLAKANGGDYIAQLSIKRCLEQKDAYYVSPAFNGSSVARDQVGLLMQECLLYGAHNSDKKADMSLIRKTFDKYIDQCNYLA